jgi:hypothetical protein
MNQVHTHPVRCCQRAMRGMFAAAMGMLLSLFASPPATAEPSGWVRVRPVASDQAKPGAAQRAKTRIATSSHERWQDRSVAELAKASFRWIISIPAAVSPFEDNEGVHCGINQEGRFWHLGAPLGAVRTCVIPAGRPLVVPIFVVVNDYPCPDPNFAPAPGQSARDFLVGGIEPVIDSVSIAEATLDGRSMRVRRITTDVFSFTGAVSQNTFDPCITGSPQIALADGYWTLIEPLSPGDHILQLRTTSAFGTLNGMFMLKVRGAEED